MNRVRIGLLVAAASIAGIPALAQAQDAGNRDQREWRGGDRGGQRDYGQRGEGRRDNQGDRGQQAAPAPQPPAAVADRGPAQQRPDQPRYVHGFSGQQPNYRPRGPEPAAAPAPTPPQQQQFAQGRPGDDRRRFDGDRGGDQRRYGNGGDRNDRRGFDNRPGDNRPNFAPRPGLDNRQAWRGNDRSAWNDRRGGFSREWRNDRRYDWRSYRQVNRNLFHFRYSPPRGARYGYRSFSIGFRLDPLFYAPSYWLDDPWQYRLPPVYGPYRWVRYYDDALLVDIESGEVVDVIHDFFW